MSTKIDAIFDALADPARRRVVELLRDGPRPAGALSEASGVSPSMMSRHLRILSENGFVADERDATDARVRMFRLRRQPFAAMQLWLDEMQAFWEGQLASFKRHAESPARGKRK